MGGGIVSEGWREGERVSKRGIVSGDSERG